jgi:hypothetical protein
LIPLALAAALGACDRLPGNQRHDPPVDARVVRMLCASDLGGPKAELHVWRDGADRVTIYELVPDTDGPSAGATALYDSRGREQLHWPPIAAPTSPERLERDRRRDAVLEDSQERETIACKLDAGR